MEHRIEIPSFLKHVARYTAFLNVRDRHAVELSKTNCHARRRLSKQSLKYLYSDVRIVCFTDKKRYINSGHTKKTHRMTDRIYPLQPRRKTSRQNTCAHQRSVNH